jgi:hypothetical protein
MKDFELIVYIVAALIYFISKNYRKVQQNRPGQQPAPAPVPETLSPKQVPVTVKKKKEVLAVPAPVPTNKKIPYQAMKRQNLARDYKTVRKTQPTDFLKTEIESTQKFFQNLMQTEEQPHPVQIDRPDEVKPYLLPEDLKKAIIYAEIIRRPYK